MAAVFYSCLHCPRAIENNSELLGHDRVWLSMLSADAFTQAVHCLLNSFLVDKMIKIVKNKKLISRLKSPQISATGKLNETEVNKKVVF
jgi:hypothetical protein